MFGEFSAKAAAERTERAYEHYPNIEEYVSDIDMHIREAADTCQYATVVRLDIDRTTLGRDGFRRTEQKLRDHYTKLGYTIKTRRGFNLLGAFFWIPLIVYISWKDVQ
jgi:hypothetical protein